MKSIRFTATLLFTTLLCFNITSCSSDDDDNGINPDAPKKRITQIITKQYEDTETAKFDYSGKKISKIVVTRTGESKPWTNEYEYSGNEVKVHITNLWFEGESKNTSIYTLNSDGYIISIDGETDAPHYTYSNGYLQRFKLGNPNLASGILEEYSYDKNWNMTKNSEFEKITYTDIPNIGELYLCYDDDLGVVSSILHAQLLGKASKYLPKEAHHNVDGEGLYIYHYEYDLDKDGYVSAIRGKITLDGKQDKADDWTETYTYEII